MFVVAGLAGAVLAPGIAAVARRQLRSDAVIGRGWTAALALFSAGLGIVLAVAGADLPALLPGLVAFGVVGTAACIVDLAEFRLPDVIVLPGALVTAVLLAGGAFTTGEPGRALGTAAGAVALAATFLVLALASRGRVGMGDVKFGLAAGAVTGAFGLHAWTTGLLAAVVLNGVAALLSIVVRRSTRGRVPFGPSILVGAVVGILLS